MKNAIIIIVVLVLATGGFFLFNSQQNTQNTTETNDAMQAAPTEAAAPESSNAMEQESTGEVKEFTVTGEPFSFSPSTMTVNQGDTVKITFKNVKGTHDFVIDELGAATAQLQEGGEETVTFVADKAGTFEYYCSVGNHRAMGMVGTLTVK